MAQHAGSDSGCYTHRAAKHSCLRLTELTWFVAVRISVHISLHSSRALVGNIRNTLASQKRLLAFLTQPMGAPLWLRLRGGDPGLLRALLCRPALLRALLSRPALLMLRALLSRPALLRALLTGHALLWDPCLVQPLLQGPALPCCLAWV